MRQWLGSIVYTILLFLSVPIYSIVCIGFRIIGYGASYAVALNWCRLQFALLRGLCRLDYSVEGLERLPASSSVVLMKHSSTWETMAQTLLFPRQCWVLKRELMWAPLLGWAIACMKPIAIDRKGGRAAVEQVMTLGRKRLEEGFWIVIFPEGTRVRKRNGTRDQPRCQRPARSGRHRQRPLPARASWRLARARLRKSRRPSRHRRRRR